MFSISSRAESSDEAVTSMPEIIRAISLIFSSFVSSAISVTVLLSLVFLDILKCVSESDATCAECVTHKTCFLLAKIGYIW